MPSELDPERLRIGTNEREEASRALGEHLAAGRLTTAEYEQRVSEVIEARTRADIRSRFADLPEPHPAFLRSAAEWRPVSAPEDTLALDSDFRSDRSSIIAGILQIVLPVGTGRFYMGDTRLAVAQLLCTLLTAGVGAIWPFIDGILLLARGGDDRSGWPPPR